MKTEQKIFKTLFYLMLCFGILSPCALLMLIVPKFYTRSFLFMVGCFFWGFFLLEMICLILCCSFRKKDLKLKKEKKKNPEPKRLPGIVSFFRNRPAVIADCLLLPLTAWVVIAFLVKIHTRWLVLGSVVICLICYQLHSILNGKNYAAVRKLNNRDSKKKENKSKEKHK